MATQFRDTQFGHFVRFLSNDNLFRYPDEIDPLLWKKRISTKSEEQSGEIEKPGRSDDSNDTAPNDLNLQGPNVDRIVEDGEDIYLVDWSGTDDPEVFYSSYSL
jgi:DHA1 family multidrug resistance protein-like MFS transporter